MKRLTHGGTGSNAAADAGLLAPTLILHVEAPKGKGEDKGVSLTDEINAKCLIPSATLKSKDPDLDCVYLV